jgi:hypothetical protein
LKSQFQYLGFHWNSNSIPRNWSGIGIEILKPSGIGTELELKSVELEWNWNSRELRRNEV